MACDPRPRLTPRWGLESPWCSFPEPPNPPPQGQPGAIPPQGPSSVFQPTHKPEYMQYPSVRPSVWVELSCGESQQWRGHSGGRPKSVISVFLFSVLLFVVAFGFLSVCFSVFC